MKMLDLLRVPSVVDRGVGLTGRGQWFISQLCVGILKTEFTLADF